MYQKRGIVVIAFLIFLITLYLPLINASRDTILPEYFLNDETNNFQYTYALGIYGADDDDSPCDGEVEDPRLARFSNLPWFDNNPLNVFTPPYFGFTTWTEVYECSQNSPKENIYSKNGPTSYCYCNDDHPSEICFTLLTLKDPKEVDDNCRWNLPKTVPGEKQGCYFLTQEFDSFSGDDSSYPDDCAGWIIPRSSSNSDNIIDYNNKNPKDLLPDPAKDVDFSLPKLLGPNDNPKYLTQGYFTTLADLKEENIFSARCPFLEYGAKSLRRSYVCEKIENEFRWYVCDEAHLSNGKNFIPIVPIAEQPSDANPTPKENSEKATEGWFCEKDESGFKWARKPLTCDNVDCSQREFVCKNNGFGWDPSISDNPCCGDDPEDFGKLNTIADNTVADKICLKQESALLGGVPETISSLFGSAPPVDGENSDPSLIEGAPSCTQNGCWVTAKTADTAFKILTIKKPGEQPYDIVSDSQVWHECKEGSPPTFESVNSEDADSFFKGNRFYCYKEGNHFSFTECYNLNGDQSKRGNPNIKGRVDGDGLYSLFLGLDEERNKPKGRYAISPNFENTFFSHFYGMGNSPVYYDFSGYDTIEFFVKFYVGEEGNFQEVTKDSLSLPISLNLKIIGPHDDSVYFNKEIMGSTNQNLFDFSKPLYFKVQIPNNLQGVSKIVLDPGANRKMVVQNIYLSDSTNPSKNKICSGIDLPRDNNWLSNFDDGNSQSPMAQGMCEARFGPNAWLGNDDELGNNPSIGNAEANCCGDDPFEYYAGQTRLQDGGSNYGCWNSQPIKHGETTMNVEVSVESMQEEKTIEYPAFPLGPILVFEFHVKKLVGDAVLNPNDGSLRLSPGGEEIEGKTTRTPYYPSCMKEKIDADPMAIQHYPSCIEEELRELVAQSVGYSLSDPIESQRVTVFPSGGTEDEYLIDIRVKSHLTVDPFAPSQQILSVDSSSLLQSNEFSLENVYFQDITNVNEEPIYHFVQNGVTSTEILTKSNLESSPSFIFMVNNQIGLIKEDSYPLIISSELITLDKTFTFPCSQSECLFALPHHVGKIINPHPDFYEIYFVTYQQGVPDGPLQEILVPPEGLFVNEYLPYSNNIKVKKVPQQVLFVNPNLDPSTEEPAEGEEPIEDAELADNEDLESRGFYTCNAPRYIDQASPEYTITSVGCEVHAGKFCAPSVVQEKTGNAFTTIFEWSTEKLTSIGYATPSIAQEQQVSFLDILYELRKEPDPTKTPLPVLSQDRIEFSSAPPRRNIIPNPTFKTKANTLPHWEVFAGSTPLEDELGQEGLHLVRDGIVTLQASNRLISERIAIADNENNNQKLLFKYEKADGTNPCSATVRLVNKEGQGRTPVEASVNRVTPIPVDVEGRDAIYAIIEFKSPNNNPCSITKPILQYATSEDDTTITAFDYETEQHITEQARSGAACCPQDACWNGYACVEDMTTSTFMVERTGAGEHYRCHAGKWKKEPLRWDWNGERPGFCPQESDCFVLSSLPIDGSIEAAAPENTAQTFYQGQYPTCIQSGQYIFDHLCNSGKWTSRTKHITTKLLEVAGNNDFTLYCTHAQDALVNIENEKFSLLGAASAAGDPAAGAPGLTGVASEEVVPVCYPEISSSIEGQRLVPTRENTCINNVCVLKVNEDDSYKVYFGTTLNELPQVDETPLPEDAELTQFVNALGLDGASVTCNEGNGFVACDLPASRKDAIYDESQNAIIYGENLAPGRVGRVFEAVSNWISSIVGNNDADAQPLDTSFINRAENIHDFYLSKEEDHEIRAIKLVEPGKAGIIAEFENYNTYLCPYIEQYVANENPPIPDLRGQLIVEESNNKRLCCAKVGPIQTIQAFVETQDASAIHDFWPNLTGKLRIENDPPTGSPEHGDDPVCEVPSFPNPLDAIEPPTAIEATQDDNERERQARRAADRRAAANRNGEPADEPEQPAAPNQPAQEQPAPTPAPAPAPQAEPEPEPTPEPDPAPAPAS